jgi:hypothetical protein
MLHKGGAAQRCAARNEGIKSSYHPQRSCVSRLSVRWGDLAGVPLRLGLGSQCLGDSVACARRSALPSRQIRCSAIDQSAGASCRPSCSGQLPLCRMLLLWLCSCQQYQVPCTTGHAHALHGLLTARTHACNLSEASSLSASNTRGCSISS